MDDQKRLAEASKSGKVDEVKEIIRNKNILINFQDDVSTHFRINDLAAIAVALYFYLF